MAEPKIPKICKAAVVVNPGPDFHVEIQHVDVPEPGPDDLLLRLNCTGLCGSDVHFLCGDLGMGQMSDWGVRSPGHEGAGVVVALGSRVDPAVWRVGDRAGLKPVFDVCHNCTSCWSGAEQYCPKAIHTGLMRTGSYQQYVVSPAIYTSRIPDGVADVDAAPMMCSGSTMHRALLDSGLKAGEFVVFPGGGGGVGISGVQLAKIMGMRPIVIDTGEQKQKLALRLGAEEFIDFREHNNVAARVKELTDGIGAHGVIVTAWQSYKDSVSYIGDRAGGKVVAIGLPPTDQNIVLGASPTLLALKKLTLMGSVVGTMQDAAAVLDYASRGLLKPICEVRPLSALPESVQQLKRGEIAGRVVIDFNA